VNTQPVSSATVNLASQALRNPASLPRQDLTQFQADDPFSAYLLSLSDPAAIAQAALANLASSTSAATTATTAANLSRLLAAGSGTAGTSTASAVTLAASLIRQLPGMASADSALAATAQAAANPPGLDATAALLAAAQAPSAQTDTSAADAASVLAAQQAQTDAQDADAAAQAAAAQAAAQNAAAAAPAAATSTAVAAVLAADTPGVDIWSNATDATAKFMGAGALAQLAGAGGNLAQGPPPQDVIPAINGVVGAQPMAANTYSNPQERAFGQGGAQQVAVPFQAASPLEGSRVDITS